MKSDPSDENEATLYSLSTEYLEAARILMETPPSRFNCSIVIYNLLGHSAELVLKSYLYKSGESIKALLKLGHNLDGLIEQARQKGLPIGSLDSISDLSSIYSGKGLDYRHTKCASFPKKAELFMEVQMLQQLVFNYVAQY